MHRKSDTLVSMNENIERKGTRLIVGERENLLLGLELLGTSEDQKEKVS